MGRRRISRQTWTYIILFWIVVIGFWWLERYVFQDTYESESGTAQTIGFPEAYIPSFEGGELIIHDHFQLSYAEQYEQAAWVAYTLDKAHLTGTNGNDRIIFRIPWSARVLPTGGTSRVQDTTGDTFVRPGTGNFLKRLTIKPFTPVTSVPRIGNSMLESGMNSSNRCGAGPEGMAGSM